MLQCWKLEPALRPSFSDLVEKLSQSLEDMVGYMDIGVFRGCEGLISESKAKNPDNEMAMELVLHEPSK